MFELSNAGGIANVGRSFDVFTRNGKFAGVVAECFKKGFCTVYFDSNCVKGSARKFTTVQAALDFIYARRISKGWGV